MGVSRIDRFAPLAGVVFFVMTIAGMVLIGQVSDTATASASEVADFVGGDSLRIIIGAYISLVAVAFLLWFVGSLRSSLVAAEGGVGTWTAVAFGGGIAAAAAMASSYAVLGSAAVRADSIHGIGPETAAALHDIYSTLLGVAAPIGFAVLIGATALIAFRTELLPTWFSWISALLAAALLTPLLFIFIIVAFIWVPVAGILLYRLHPASEQHRPTVG